MTDLEHFQELAFYTLSKGDAEFMHQHAVDAYAAQHAGLDTKPVSLVFGLIGLYLALDKGWTGRQVQLFHMKMARYKRPWPVIPIPPDRGDIIVEHVLATEPGLYGIGASWTGAHRFGRHTLMSILSLFRW